MRIKKMQKTIFAIVMCTAIIAMSCVSAFAAEYTVTTKYSTNNDVAVKATATNVGAGEYVTYVATKNGDVVYIDQGKGAQAGDTVEFTYKVDGDDIDAFNCFGGVGQKENVSNEEFYSATVKFEHLYAPEEDYSANYLTAFIKYDDEVDPYVVAREINVAVGNYNVKSVTVNGVEVEDYIVKNDKIILYTDLISADNTEIVVNLVPAKETKVHIGVASASAEGVVITAQTNAVSDFGIVVSKTKDGFENPVSWSSGLETNFANPVKLPALGKNDSGVYAVELIGLDAGTYYFQAYAEDATDSLDANKEAVSYTF